MQSKIEGISPLSSLTLKFSSPLSSIMLIIAFLFSRSVKKSIRGLTPLFLILFLLPVTGFADEREEALRGLGSENRKVLMASIKVFGKLNDPSLLPILKALKEKKIRITPGGNVVILENKTSGMDVITGETISLEGLKLNTPKVNNAVRRVLNPVIGQLQLASPNPKDRLKAAQELTKRSTDEAIEPIRHALSKETEDVVREALTVALAVIGIQSEDKKLRLDAIRTFGDSGNIRFKSILQKLLTRNEDGSFQEPDPEIREAASRAIKDIESAIAVIELVGDVFRGISLGSVLLLAALGLAITFGLMKVINMAHGEMLMLGAYSTYLVQNIFQTHLNQFFSFYLLLALPVAFLIPALVGMVIERSVIRFLYGRPLETLLATWGISLLLIQTVRLIFGAQNVEVANPKWLAGGVQIAQGLVFPFSRITIIFFTLLVVIFVGLLLQKTSLGLQVRAVTQNRKMASCMGISSSRTDMWTFGLGSGIAGLGGLALSQLGNVGPELGQLYIVDSFMVVVFGGVGKILGTVASAMGLGVINKFLEPYAGAVFGKIVILVFIIVVLQMRPRGLFAPKGRLLEN